MNPSEPEPSPIHKQDLSDLIRLLERNPEALKQLKETLNAEPAVAPAAPSIPATAPEDSPPAPLPKLADSRASLANRQAPAPRAAVSKPTPALVSHGTPKAIPAIKSTPTASALAQKEAAEQADFAPPLPTAPPQAVSARRRAWELIGGGSLAFAVLLHLILLIVAAVWIFQIVLPPEKTVDFMPPGGGGGERGAEYNVQQKKRAQITPSSNVKRVFAEGAISNYSIPDPGDNFGEMSALTSLAGGGLSGGLGGSGLGSGFGKGTGSGAGSALGGAGDGKLFGPLNLFGQKGSLEGIEGTFRDFKMDRNKKPTGTDPSMANYVKILKPFERSGWGSSRWKNYESPTQLSAKFFFFPAIQDRMAGPAFDSKDSQAGLWVAHYRGRCTASMPGKYRFVGWGDNVLAVKIGGKVVLDASDVQRSGGPFLSKRQAVGSVSFPNKKSTTIFVGEWVRFGASEVAIEVLLGDQGGIFCAGLFIQPEGTPLTFGSQGIPNIPLFLMGELSEGELKLLKDVPPQSLKGPIFMAKSKMHSDF